MQKCFRIILTIFSVAWLVGCSLGGQEQAQPNNQEEEKAIRNAVQAYEEAFNEQDASKLTSFWVPDASYFNPLTGEFAEGSDAIEKLYRKKIAQGLGNFQIAIKNIKFLNADEAIVVGILNATFRDQPLRQFAFQVTYVKKDGKWLLNDLSEIQREEASSHFEQLKDLGWLVGKWEDSDDHVQILFDNQWDKYKNFITQHFQMKIYEQDEIEGKQIIAWDPVKETIRSW